MQESDALEQLLSEAPDMGRRERVELVVPEEVEDALVEELRYDADMIAIRKSIEEVDTLVVVGRVVLTEGAQYANLDLTGVAILLDCANDLDGDVTARMAVVTFYDFTERTLT